MKLLIDDRSPAEVLMSALEMVDGASKVVILLEKDDALVCKTNVAHRELKWVLDQALFVTMADTFGVLDKESL